MERKDFDTLVEKYFPGAPRHRQEGKSGWIDEIEIGKVMIEIAVLQKPPRGSSRHAGVGAYIRVKSDTQGNCLIWSKQDKPCDMTTLEKVVSELRKNLLGIAAAITQVCGFTGEVPKEFDVDEFINDHKDLGAILEG